MQSNLLSSTDLCNVYETLLNHVVVVARACGRPVDLTCFTTWGMHVLAHASVSQWRSPRDIRHCCVCQATTDKRGRTKGELMWAVDDILYIRKHSDLCTFQMWSKVPRGDSIFPSEWISKLWRTMKTQSICEGAETFAWENRKGWRGRTNKYKLSQVQASN